MPILEARGLSKRYDTGGLFSRLAGRADSGITALDYVSFKLERGETLGIVGESGAGKTTLALLILGLLEPTCGIVLVDGKEYHHRRNERRERARRIQLVWQDSLAALDPRQRIVTSVVEPLLIHRLVNMSEARKAAEALLTEVGLEASLLDRYPGELSGGQAQRVVIARALALNPDIVLCDEFASALDARAKVRIADLLIRLRKERQLTYIIIAHDLPVVSMMTDSVAVMYRGSIVEQGPTRLILEEPLHPYTRLLVSSDPATQPDFLEGPVEPAPAGDQLEATNSSGCAFSPRCPDSTEACLKEKIVLQGAGDRAVACRELKI